MYQELIKRVIDLILSFVGLIILTPFLIIIFCLIKMDSSGPVLYKQKRIGKDGREFQMLKMRSMKVESEKGGVFSKKGDPRVTRIGKLIRVTSIDEIPQLINIIRGEMSLIGPRPVLPYHPWEYEKYTKEQIKRFKVRPGITGWAQVHGRKDLEWDQRLKYDVEYVEKLSFALDLEIFFLTIYKVVFMKDNYNIESTINEIKSSENDCVEVKNDN